MEPETDLRLTYPLNKKSKTKSPHRRRKIVTIILIIVGILIVLSTVTAYQVKAAYGQILIGKESLTKVQDAVARQDLKSAAQEIQTAETEFTKARDAMAISGWTVIVPYVGTQLSVGRALLDEAVVLTSALSKTVTAGLDVLEPLQSQEITNFSQMSPAQKRAAIEKLEQSAPVFEEARADIQQSRLRLDALPAFGVYQPITDAKNLILENLPQAERFMDEILLGAKILPKIAGYPVEQQYLFVSQNNHELRASGGFIGNIGIVRVASAEIKDFTTKGVYNLDEEAPVRIEPPDYLQKYLKSTTWYLRDANTCVGCADFAVAAKKILEFYKIETGQESFDGVISVTPTFLEDLLKITGPIKVPGYPYTFTSENVTATLQEHVEVNYAQMGIPMTDRQSIISDLSHTILQKVFTLPKEKWFDLFKTLREAFLEKHAMIYVKNEAAQKILRAEGWTSELRNDFDQDYITIADNNMAALKTDRVMDRVINYSVDLSDPGAPTAKLQITYINQGRFTLLTTRYRTWAQVYVPASATLISGDGAEVTDRETPAGELREEIDPNSGRKVWSYFKSIEPGTQETVTINYRLPSDVIKNDHYALLFQKQAGTPQFKLNVSITAARQPRTVNSTAAYQVAGQTINFDTDLLVDREFSINY